MRKERIVSFDLIRAMSALLIIFYHSIRLYESVPDWNHFTVPSAFVNGDWGHLAVVPMFFMLSGAALVYNYPKLSAKELKAFFFKRWKSLFPAFYLVWFYYYVTTAVKQANPLYGGNPVRILLTVFGVDGYFLYQGPNYYQVGEWFLGAIVFLYLLYPVLLFCYNRFFVVSTAIVTALFLLTLKFNPFKIALSDNLLVCLFSFWCGMAYMKFRKYMEKKAVSVCTGILSLAGVVVLCCVPFHTNAVFCMTLAGILLFLFLDRIGEAVMRLPVFGRFFLCTGGLSYELFLVHHKVIFALGACFIAYFNSNFLVSYQWITVFALYPACFLVAKAVQLLIREFYKTPLFQKIEGFFLS